MCAATALWANDVHQPQQLRFEPGDIIRIGLHNHEGTGWSSVRDARRMSTALPLTDQGAPQGQRLLDGTLGWFPSNLVIIREEESEADEDEPASS
jgi:hypothetical protein